MNKELTYETGKIEAEAGAGHWSAAFEFAPPSASEKASRGVLTAATSIAASDKFDAALAGRQILSALQETYYTQTTGGILPALEKAVTAAHQRLVTLVFSGEGGEEAVDFNLVVGVLWGSVFYLAQLGEARAVIRRGGELKLIGHRADITESDLTVGEKPDIRTASGLLEVGDKIILGTPKFFDSIPAPELGAALENGAGSFVAGKLQEKFADKAGAAALILTLGVEGTPTPSEDALIAVEPETRPEEKTEEVRPEEKEAAKEETPAEIASEVTSEEPAETSLSEEKPEEEMTEPTEEAPVETAEPAHPAGPSWTARVGALIAAVVAAVTSATKSVFGATSRAGIPGFLGRALGRAWDSLGKPRTAVEGVVEARNRRTLLVLAGVALLILLLGVALNGGSKADTSKKDRFDSLMASAQAGYDQAKEEASLDNAAAKANLTSTQNNLTEADSLDIDDAKVNALRAQVATLLEELNNVYRVTPASFLDLTSIRVAASGVDLTGNKDTLYILDPTGGLYQVATADKKVTTLSSDLALTKAQNIFQVGTNLFAYVPGQGVYGYDTKTKKLLQAAKNDTTWGKIADWGVYNAYAYALDTGKGVILRYAPGSASQLGTATTWMKSTAADVTTGTSIVVDGAVWVSQGGEILKFTKGTKETFTLSGVEPAPTVVRSVYATPDTKNLYFLDGNRLVVTDKTGAYLSQYVSDKLTSGLSLLVDEAGKKAYILAEKEILLLELR